MVIRATIVKIYFFSSNKRIVYHAKIDSINLFLYFHCSVGRFRKQLNRSTNLMEK